MPLAARYLLPAAGAAVALAVTLAPLASAQTSPPASGPDSAACATANAAVLAAALEAHALAEQVDAGQDKILADLKKAVDDAQTAYDTVYAKYQATPPTATLDEVKAAQTSLRTALDALDDAPGIPEVQRSALAAATAKVSAAIAEREKACQPTTPTTTSATPTTTVTPPATTTPAPSIPIPSSIDTGRAA